MFGGDGVVRRADVLEELDVWPAASRAAFDSLVEDARDEQCVVPDVRAEEEALRGCGLLQSEEHIADVLLRPFAGAGGCAHSLGATKFLQQRCEVICSLAAGELMLFQHMAEEDVEVALRGDLEVRARFQHGLEKWLAI